jgi:hypothetical protein
MNFLGKLSKILVPATHSALTDLLSVRWGRYAEGSMMMRIVRNDKKIASNTVGKYVYSTGIVYTFCYRSGW